MIRSMDWAKIAVHWQKEHGVPMDRIIGSDGYTIPQLWAMFAEYPSRPQSLSADDLRDIRNRQRIAAGKPPVRSEKRG